eukprot:5455946-Pleurochrysis_carterae.AAC.1
MPHTRVRRSCPSQDETVKRQTTVLVTKHGEVEEAVSDLIKLVGSFCIGGAEAGVGEHDETELRRHSVAALVARSPFRLRLQCQGPLLNGVCIRSRCLVCCALVAAPLGLWECVLLLHIQAASLICYIFLRSSLLLSGVTPQVQAARSIVYRSMLFCC